MTTIDPTFGPSLLTSGYLLEIAREFAKTIRGVDYGTERSRRSAMAMELAIETRAYVSRMNGLSVSRGSIHIAMLRRYASLCVLVRS